MKTSPGRFLLFLAILPCLSMAAYGEDLSHFRRAEIPRSEARLSELAGVREFRCDYELGRAIQGTLLIAERYKDGACIGRFRLARAKYDTSRNHRTGIISLGWQRDAERLVSVHDNGDMYSPWTARAVFPGFKPMDACYFTNSKPEARKPERQGGLGFELYPVMAICGERNRQIRYPESPDTRSFLAACGEAGASEAVIIYLYFSPSDEEPSAGFSNS
ncbi:hypothetical protein KBB96_17050 [Luteolibacter ambystomatis]|uniref:Uncharacterized protein n=1 Tax=Luteolibacter ambystomatis TaxID=2824561 RepID=A0A975G7M0_9BACT|nr:hypothetical protein [Luteolibacter ambystomatis]QUE50559.1 hypothetical protein KBB96_17050 [Luteolibacter ambystomatis]